MSGFKQILVVLDALRKYGARYGMGTLFRKAAKSVYQAVAKGDASGVRRQLRGVAFRHAATLDYPDWIARYERLGGEVLAEQRARSFGHRPRFSIVVPTYDTPRQMLVECIESVLAQSYPDWELCIADDASAEPHVRETLAAYAARDERIRVAYRESNGHISEATNTALAMATGDFICLMDHDDTLAPNALYEFAAMLNDDPGLDFIYSDEDKISCDGSMRFDPFFKPDWSPEYLECCMYTAHFACYRADIVRRIGGFRPAFDGAQDYDFVLRFTEQARKIGHVPKVLYHGRALPGAMDVFMDNVGDVADAAVRALQEHAMRTGRQARVDPSPYPACFRVRYRAEDEPRVSIVIPSAGRNSVIRGREMDILAHCIGSNTERSTYRNIEIVVVDNDDLRPETLAALAAYPVRFVHYTAPEFNVAAKMNLGARHAAGEYLLFLNDDIEVISEDWIEAMLSLAQQPGVGAVGPKLFFEDGSQQHVGISFCDGLPYHIHRGFPGDDPGYFFSSEGQRNYLAVTGACVLLNKALFDEVGGFEEAFAINYNDIDLCLRIWQHGFRNVYTGQAKLYHFESRNRERTVAAPEIDLFRRRWADKVSPDPYYSRYFDVAPPNFQLRQPEID